LTLVLLGAIFAFLWKESHQDSPATFRYKRESVKLKAIKDTGQALPGKLLIEPGKYEVFGKVFNLEREGLYQFVIDGKTQNRIVYKNDPWAIISAVSWLDNPSAKSKRRAKSTEIKDQAMGGYIDLSCGNLSSFTDVLLGEANIESRSATGVNIDALASKSDTGHTVLEIKMDNRWQVVDVDNNVVPQKNGKTMTFWELLNTLKQKENYDLVKLATDKNDKDDKAIKEYYAKLLKIGLINDKRFYYFVDDASYTQKVRDYAKIYMPLPRKEWLEKFYPGYGYE